MEYLLDLLNMNSIDLNYQYMTESLETVRAKIVLNFQQQRSLGKLAELSLNENNKNFYAIIKNYENLQSRVFLKNFYKKIRIFYWKKSLLQ